MKDTDKAETDSGAAPSDNGISPLSSSYYARLKAQRIGAKVSISRDKDGFVYRTTFNGKTYIDYTPLDCEETIDDLIDKGAMRQREATQDETYSTEA